MRQSQLFTQTKKEVPSDEVALNAQLLIRAGYIHKEMAGVYSYLPLGLRVFENIKQIIREEMNAIGGQELFLTTLQDPEIWKKSGRWVDEGEDASSGLPWFKTKLFNGTELGVANTHEEALANVMVQHIRSHKHLPCSAYQFQNKFRNELRAKSGLMRGREFMMKDLYSFAKNQEELDDFYEVVADAYMNIFTRCGIGDITHRTFASGGAFSKFSDEFQTLSDAGEDLIYIDDEKGIAINKEVHTPEVLAELGVDPKNLREEKAIEVGNIFKLGTKYAESQGLLFEDEDGARKPVIMGSYGIGVGRVMGTVVEVLSDEKGIVWPRELAPYQVHLVSLLSDNTEKADNLYDHLRSKGIDVLYDDRDVRAGQKFADSDLLGMPTRLVISERSIGNGQVECVDRKTGSVTMVAIEDAGMAI